MITVTRYQGDALTVQPVQTVYSRTIASIQKRRQISTIN